MKRAQDAHFKLLDHCKKYVSYVKGMSDVTDDRSWRARATLRRTELVFSAWAVSAAAAAATNLLTH